MGWWVGSTTIIMKRGYITLTRNIHFENFALRKNTPIVRPVLVWVNGNDVI